MFCSMTSNSATICYNSPFGSRTCHTTTDHPGSATTTCRRGLFGDRCTTRIIPGTRENTTCRTGIFGDTTCRTTYSRPCSSWGYSYGFSYDPYWSAPHYRSAYSYSHVPCDDGGLGSFVLGLLGITFLAAACIR